MTLYANLDYTKRKLKTAQPTAATLSANDMEIVDDLRSISLRLDSEFPLVPRWPFFAPWQGLRKFLVTSDRVNTQRNTFQWTPPLLALTGDITLGTLTLVVGTDVELWPDSTQPPFNMLRLISRSQSWYDGCAGCDAPLQVTIPGIWGYHRDYANAFPELTTLAAAVTTTTQTTLTFTNLSAATPYGITPGISAGSLLQIDDEYIEVTVPNFPANTATVLRGVNGSAAATHSNGAAVQVWQVEAPVQDAVARQAGLKYARLGAYTTIEIVGMSEIRYPADWLVEVRAMMQGYSLGY